MIEQEAGHEEIPNLYIIEGKIHFYTDDNTLQNVINGDTVTLLSTAAECFRILIQEQGRIVSRKEMKEQVWGKRGVIVSSNTFYQNMLNLRRGLEKVGAGSHIISTHYGKGVAIDSGIDITTELYNSPSTTSAINEQSDSEKKNIFIPHHITDGKISVAKKKGNNLFLAMINLTLAVLCIAMFYMGETLKRENYFSEYTRTPYSVKSCSVYTDSSKVDNNDLKQILNHTTPNCEHDEKLYLSSVHPVRRMSIIRCAGNFLTGDECKSDYYLE